MATIIIGLSGDRQQGKSEFAKHLVENHGFSRLHPFSGGKAASRGYFIYLGADEDTASRMTDGDLKDIPSPLLPVEPESGNFFTPRFWMEKFGQFMGVQMGPDWTIGRELKLKLDSGSDVRLVAESIVYEADVLRNLGGTIIRVERRHQNPDAPRIEGVETDAYSRLIKPDHLFVNDTATISEMRLKIDDFLEGTFSISRQPCGMEI